MKKILITTLALFSFVTLTACGNSAKKLTADEAKDEIKAVQTNTATVIANAKGFDIQAKTDLDATISAKNIKVDTTLPVGIEIKTAKFSAELGAKAGLIANLEKGNFKATASEDASVKFNYTMNDDSQKFSVSSKGNGEAYLMNGTDKVNLYAKGKLNNDIKLPEDYAALIDTDDYKELEGKINIKADKNPNDSDDLVSNITNGSYIEEFTSIDFDTLIKDWTIFSKKGSKLIADCSKLTAFNIEEDIQAELAEMGLTLKVSKLEIGMNKNSEVTSFDFAVSLKGTVDLAKQEIDVEDIKDFVETIYPAASTMINASTIKGISGTVTIDTTYSFGFDVDYKASSFTVPTELTSLEEIDIEDLLDEIFDGGGKADPTETAAITKAENVLAAAKTVILESTATGTPAIDGVVIVGNTYSVGVADLVKAGELTANPCAATESEDGGITVMYDSSTNKWTFIATATIDGYDIYYSNGEFEAYKD